MKFAFLKDIFSEADGSGSSSRVMIGLIIAFILGVGVSFAIEVHRHKITPEQFSNFLGSSGTFITITTAPLYAINKGADAFKGRNGNGTNGGQ